MLAADAAVAATVTSDPATISFGSIQAGAALPLTRTFIIKKLGYGERNSCAGSNADGRKRRGNGYGDSAQCDFGAGSFDDCGGNHFRIGSCRGSIFGIDYGAGRSEFAAHPVSIFRSGRSGSQCDSAGWRFL